MKIVFIQLSNAFLKQAGKGRYLFVTDSKLALSCFSDDILGTSCG
jgi:hypothetical protein